MKIEKKNKINKFVIISCIFFVIFFALHQNIIYTSYKYVMPDPKEEIDINNDVIAIEGYELKEKNYIKKEENAYIKIKAPIDVLSLKINLKKFSKKNVSIKLYYSIDDSSYNEANTVTSSINNEQNSIVFNIPSENGSQFFMMKIDSSFCLDSIEISQHNATLEKIESSNSDILLFIIINLLVSTILAAIIEFNDLIDRLISNIKKIDKKRVKKYVFRGITYCCTVALLLLVQIFFTHQFIAKIGNKYIINTMRLSFSIMIVTLFYGFIWLRKDFKNKIENIFLLVSLSVGITYAIATPMLQETTWDAGIHYGNTIELVYVDQDKLPSLDKSVGWLEYSYNLNDLNTIKDKYDTNYYYVNGMVDTQGWSLTKIYNSLGYLPHAFGIFVARGLTLSFTTSIMLGKIFSSIFYSIIIYLAMKKLKTGKLIMFILAMYPTALMLAGTYSYDSWVNAWIFLGFAYLFTNMQEKNKYISWKEVFITLGSLFIAIGPKAIYFPLMILCYFMPKSKFKTKKDRRLYYALLTIFIFLAIISFLVPFVFGVSAGTEIGDTRGGTDVNSTLQVKYILSNPFQYTKVLLLFLKDYWSFGNIANYSTNLAYIGQGQYSYLLVISMLVILIVGDTSKYENNIKIYFKVFTGFLVFGISCLVASAFYVAYTPVGANFIAGCQPRYLLPILFPIAYCLRNVYKPIRIQKIEIINFLIIFISTSVSVYTLFSKIIMIYNIY